MTEALLKCVASYLLGSLMGSLIVGRLSGGVDIRELGSGNAGGTNALRTQGGMFAFWVMVIDIGKGYLATGWLAPMALPVVPAASSQWRDWLPVLCGMAAILGHVWPLWFGFRGGKGVATVLGVMLGIQASLLLPMLLAWLVVVMLCGYVSLGSIAASAVLPAYVAWHGVEPLEPLVAFGIAVALFVVYTHRSNIARMRAGTESRARRLWLLGRRHA